MSRILWTEPEKKLSPSEWKKENDHPEHPTYEPNMSPEDAERWRGKLFPQADPPRVEVKRMLRGVSVNLVIRLEDSWERTWNREKILLPAGVAISMNGTAKFSFEEFAGMCYVIDEAMTKLNEARNGKYV